MLPECLYGCIALGVTGGVRMTYVTNAGSLLRRIRPQDHDARSWSRGTVACHVSFSYWLLIVSHEDSLQSTRFEHTDGDLGRGFDVSPSHWRFSAILGRRLASVHGRRIASAIAGCTIALALSTGAGTGAGAVPAQPSIPRSALVSDDLTVTEETTTSLEGDYSSGSYVIPFTATSSSGEAFAALASGKVLAQFTVAGGKRFDLTQDAAAGTATWGGGGSKLTAADRDAIAGFALALESYFDGQVVSEHEARLVKFANLISEAPLEIPLEPVDVPMTVESLGDERTAAPGPEEDCRSVDGAGGVSAMASCNQAEGEEGIRYMSCSTIQRQLEHDWCPTNADIGPYHGYNSYSTRSGPLSTSCLGRCGGGCGSQNGLGAYTFDCGDHDSCNRTHGSQLGGCRDEFYDADDDYLWGDNRCSRG